MCHCICIDLIVRQQLVVLRIGVLLGWDGAMENEGEDSKWVEHTGVDEDTLTFLCI
jgi:hypothetical protein